MRFVRTVTVRQLLSATVLLSVFALISSRSAHTPDETLARIQFAASGLQQQQQQVDVLKKATEQQLAGVIYKLAELEGEMQQLNMLGNRLVEKAKLDSDEFSFSQPQALSLGDENELLARIEAMRVDMNSKAAQLRALESIMLGHHIDHEASVSGRPIKQGWLSSYYGVRKDPFTGKPAMHKGIDFAGEEGEPVVATGAGVVTWSGERYGYGNMVEIDHGDGIVSRYGHALSLSVKVGDVVTKGQQIALMGNTGRSTGAHVHYEVLQRGQQQDPLPYVY